jgi:CubicO group peptidase (beta-lactamase class C family)
MSRIHAGMRAVVGILAVAGIFGDPCLAKAVPAADGHAIATAATPESVGFSSERLAAVHALIEREIDRGELAGAVTILARHGRIVDYRTYGVSDLARGTPMRQDAIFRAYSMTKPITGVAMMILYEQGKWLPQEPIAKYIPQFADLKVFGGFDSVGNEVLVAPDHPPLIRELMSHTAGFTYGMGITPVDSMYRRQKVLQSANLQQMIDKLARIPLDYQPGTRWKYSLSMDIEGYLIEKLSGQSLPDFMREHIFRPLRMTSTGFYVPGGERSRFATNYQRNAQGRLMPVGTEAGVPADYRSQPPLPSGGGGLVSTAMDYYRFAQMLANGGELDGRRVLSPATVHLMTTNKLGEHLLTGQFGIGEHVMRPGFGYGFNCAVVFDPALAALPVGKGTFFWDGAAGTWFWVDPTNDVVFVAMIQRMLDPDNHSLEYKSQAAVYGALIDPAK